MSVLRFSVFHSIGWLFLVGDNLHVFRVFFARHFLQVVSLAVLGKCSGLGGGRESMLSIDMAVIRW